MPHKLYFQRTWLALGIILLLLIITGSLIPLPKTAPGYDKAVHVAMYFVLTMWFILALDNRNRIYLVISFIGLGALLEVAQRATGYRSFEWADMLANSMGVVLAWVLSYTGVRSVLAWLDTRLARMLGREG